MSTNLHWRPVGSGEAVDAEPDTLKLIIRDRFGMTHENEPIRMDSGSRPFLEGLKAAKVSGANHLLKLIEQYGEIDVYESE